MYCHAVKPHDGASGIGELDAVCAVATDVAGNCLQGDLCPVRSSQGELARPAILEVGRGFAELHSVDGRSESIAVRYPVLPGRLYLDWPVPDPAGATLEEMHTIRDDIDARTEALLAELLPAT
jgi:hypothetical protein